MPSIARACLTFALLAAGVPGVSCFSPPPPPCGCMTLDAAVRGVERVSDRDWQKTDPAALDEDWPEGVPCQAGPAIGLEAASDAIARCCDACEVCGGAAIDDAGGAGLRAVQLWVCPKPPAAQHAALRRLAHAAAAGREPVSVSRSDASVIEGYAWAANGTSFMLRTDAIDTDDAWLGQFQWGRCRAEDVVDSWRIGRDLVVAITRADVDREATGDAAFRFAHVSTCLIHDGECRGRELDRLWPALRARAEQEKATAIHIGSEDCTGRSLAFRLARGPDGRWTGGPWTPRDR